MNKSTLWENIDNISHQNFNTNYLGLVRSLLAISTISILLFNSNNILFPYGNFSGILGIEPPTTSFFSHLNIFKWFGLENIIFAKLACFTILALVISGYRPRIMCIPHFIVIFSLNQSIMPINGGDQINQILCLFLIPICLFDKRQNHWQTEIITSNKSEISSQLKSQFIFAIILLIRIQMSCLYLDAAVGKLKVDEWLNGTALHYWVNNDAFGSSGLILNFLNFLFNYPPLLAFFTWSVIILELSLFAGIYANKGTKHTLLILGLSFHFMIILVHGLISFFFSIAAGLILYLAPINKSFKLPKLSAIAKLKLM